jgi:hypothetical protein
MTPQLNVQLNAPGAFAGIVWCISSRGHTSEHLSDMFDWQFKVLLWIHLKSRASAPRRS